MADITLNMLEEGKTPSWNNIARGLEYRKIEANNAFHALDESLNLLAETFSNCIDETIRKLILTESYIDAEEPLTRIFNLDKNCEELIESINHIYSSGDWMKYVLDSNDRVSKKYWLKKLAQKTFNHLNHVVWTKQNIPKPYKISCALFLDLQPYQIYVTLHIDDTHPLFAKLSFVDNFIKVLSK